jgi:hypothetical protein
MVRCCGEAPVCHQPPGHGGCVNMTMKMHNRQKRNQKKVKMGMLQSVNIYSQFNKYIFAHKLGSVQNVQKYAVKHNFEINYYVIGT